MENMTLFDDHNDSLLLFYKIFSPICVLINGLAVYLIIFKSSREMKTYRWHLLHYQVIASALDIFINFLFQPIFFYPLPALTGHGFLIRNLGISTFTCHSIYLNLLCALNISIVELFFYRHQCIVRNKLTKKQFYFCLAFAYIILSFLLNVYLVLLRIDPCEGSDMLKNVNSWVVELQKIPNVYYLQPSSRTMMALFIFMIAIFLLNSFVPCLVCHIVYALWKKSKYISVRTRKMQRKFLTSLIWQVTVPLVFLFIPLVFVSIRSFDGRLGLQMLNNMVTMLLSSYGIFATLCLIYFNDPYREFLFGRLKRKSKLMGFRDDSPNNSSSFTEISSMSSFTLTASFQEVK